MVKVVAPGCDEIACMAHVVEQVLVQTFISHAPIETFYEPILHRLAGCDVMPVNLPVFLLLQDRIRRQLRAVV